jgi:hypothetical protein
MDGDIPYCLQEIVVQLAGHFVEREKKDRLIDEEVSRIKI